MYVIDAPHFWLGFSVAWGAALVAAATRVQNDSNQSELDVERNVAEWWAVAQGEVVVRCCGLMEVAPHK